MGRKIIGTLLALGLVIASCGDDGGPTTEDRPTDEEIVATPVPAAATPTPTPQPRIYVVQGGDTLSGIATNFDLDMQEIIDLNGITDPAALQVGDELILPQVESTDSLDPGAGGEIVTPTPTFDN